MHDQAIQAATQLVIHARRLHELLAQARDVINKLSAYESPSHEMIGTLVGCVNQALDLMGPPPCE
jgi:hypothetical protein